MKALALRAFLLGPNDKAFHLAPHRGLPVRAASHAEEMKGRPCYKEGGIGIAEEEIDSVQTKMLTVTTGGSTVNHVMPSLESKDIPSQARLALPYHCFTATFHPGMPLVLPTGPASSSFK